MTIDATYIPLDAAESSVLKDTNMRLPKAVYEQLAVFIRQAVANLPGRHSDLNDTRSHTAISIDGARGTGKTSVLVNLKRYIEQDHKDLLADIHVIEPIDPTLLEDGESLFLHVIVAAVLHDKYVKEAQRDSPDQSRELQKHLEKLVHALESVERQQDQHGMDKVRALYGNKQLADCVQNFICAALVLLNKKLLVLPIDDVDTSLNRAFENLEIIRRYLTSPYVLPIVSGDRSLYNEVVWRDFHGRLTRDSTYKRQQAYEIAKDLAYEYQRKILPLPRRLTMPSVSEYWKNADIKLRGKEGDILSLQNFYAWLEIFVTGPVNGQEGSRLLLPIPSIRALMQLINHCGDLIPSLPAAICKADNVLQVRRSWQMPTVPQSLIEEFHLKHQELSNEKKREYGAAYRLFSKNIIGKELAEYHSDANAIVHDWASRLAVYFSFEPQAGAVYLVLLANQHWQQRSAGKSVERQRGIFDTPLFQPLQHVSPDFSLFEKQDDLSDWSNQLENRLPESWLTEVKGQQTILPYPVVEVGTNSAINWKYWEDIANLNPDKVVQDKAIFLLSLLTQHNYYTKSKQSMMLNIGRVFEIIVSSLVGPLEFSDLQCIKQQAPFFSTSALASTKVIDISFGKSKSIQKEVTVPIPVDDRRGEVLESIDDHLILLHREIVDWREKHGLDNVRIAPWLVYKVFNKVYSQVASAEQVPSGMKIIDEALGMVGMAFYATWSAFGSFEKGILFGLPDVVAQVNLNSPTGFEMSDHYLTNVGPFAPTNAQIEKQDSSAYKERNVYGKQTRTASYFLADHPLRVWIDQVLSIKWTGEEQEAGAKISKKQFTPDQLLKIRVCQELGLATTGRLTENVIRDKIKSLGWQKDKFESVLFSIKTDYKAGKALENLVKAGATCFPNSES